MREISVSQGLIAFVDDEDYESLSTHKWCAMRARHNFYAVRKGTTLAQIRVAGHTINLVRFDDPVFAARVYDVAAIKYFGEFARTNFTF